MATAAKGKEHIHVYLRVRPLNSAEKRANSTSVVEIIGDKDVRVQSAAGNINKTFTFDRVFSQKSKQVEVYREVLVKSIDEVLAGFNCTVFAYGQTGSGKTYTMEGERSADVTYSWENDPKSGIIPRCLSQIFDVLLTSPVEHTVKVSFLEIYNEELIDLLASNDGIKLKLFDDSTKKGSVIVSGLEEETVGSKEEIYKILEKGAAKRQTACTFMNAHSSRSHTIFSITVHVKEVIDGGEFFRTGKLNLVDLAGSENIGRSGAIDRRAREAGSINQSLLTLGRVITSLVEHRPHIPYRESKLTRMLQDSLGGRTKTSIIATISPAAENIEETLSTLNYAFNAKKIVNKPEANQKQTHTVLLKEYIEEINRLKKDLKAARNKEGICIAEENYNDMVAKIKNQHEEISEKINTIEAMEKEAEKLEKIIEELQSKNNDNEVVIVQTSLERDEEKFIVEQMVKGEQRLLSQAEEIKSVASQAVAHVNLLHDKLSRKDMLDHRNQDVLKDFFNYLSDYFVKISECSFVVEQQCQSLDIQNQKIGKLSEDVEVTGANLKSGLHNIVDSLVIKDVDKLKKKLYKNKNNLEQLWSTVRVAVKDLTREIQLADDELIKSNWLPAINDVLYFLSKTKSLIKTSYVDIGHKVVDIEKLVSESNILCEYMKEMSALILMHVDNSQNISVETINLAHMETFASVNKIIENTRMKVDSGMNLLSQYGNDFDHHFTSQINKFQNDSKEFSDVMSKNNTELETKISSVKCDISQLESVSSTFRSSEKKLKDIQTRLKSILSEPISLEGLHSENDFSRFSLNLIEEINCMQTANEKRCQSISQQLTSFIDTAENKTAQISHSLNKFTNSIEKNVLNASVIEKGGAEIPKEYIFPSLDEKNMCINEMKIPVTLPTDSTVIINNLNNVDEPTQEKENSTGPPSPLSASKNFESKLRPPRYLSEKNT